jgi:hypothetical protein
MPTGYTADIENDITFEDYVLGCARAFGATMHQRDDNMKDKPKLRNTESSYHVDALSRAKTEVAKLEAMRGVNDRTAFGKKVIEEETASNQEYFNKKVSLRNKYEAMLQKAYNWFPPTLDHENLKKFMIEQITQSIDFDCDTKYAMDRLTELSKANPLDKYNDALRRAYKDVEYHETELMKERERNADANKWISALYDSLGIEYDTI